MSISSRFLINIFLYSFIDNTVRRERFVEQEHFVLNWKAHAQNRVKKVLQQAVMQIV